MPYQAIILMTIFYGISTFFDGHQASHLFYIKEGHQPHYGRVTLNPLLVLILWFYQIAHLPWLILIIIGYETTWYYPIIVILLSQIVRFSLVAIEMRLKINGALISLAGILIMPLTLYFVYFFSSDLL